MILVDSNVLIGLAERRDWLHARAVQDLARLAREPLRTISPAIAEALHVVRSGFGRAGLAAILLEHEMEPVGEDSPHFWVQVFDWLRKYQEHEPDWADACLAVLCGKYDAAKVWTYDREFLILWRKPDGSPIPLAVPI